jgi:hypothetical protein
MVEVRFLESSLLTEIIKNAVRFAEKDTGKSRTLPEGLSVAKL